MPERGWSRARFRCRRSGIGWRGELIEFPSFVDYIVDDARPRLVWAGFALTERGVRNRAAAFLRRRRSRRIWRTSFDRRAGGGESQ